MTAKQAKRTAVGALSGLGRRTRAIAVVMALSMGIVAATAGTAHAGGTNINDGFEGDPSGTWTIEHYGNSNGGFDIGAGLARSGYNNAWLTASSSFSAVERSFTFSTALSRSCGAEIYIASFGVSTVSLEVIDPRTWTGTWRTVSLSSSAYTQVVFPAWTWRLDTVVLRVSLIGDGRSYGILIDDLRAHCTSAYP